MAATHYVGQLAPNQVGQLREILSEANWELDGCEHAHWRARRDKTTVVAYLSGKLVVQGKGTAEFVQFTLEPQVLGEARFGYEKELAVSENPDMFKPHAGIDESGKGDYFGPLVVAAVYVDETTAAQLLELGVADSKTIKNDKRIATLAGQIVKVTAGAYSIVPIGPAAYNRLYAKIGNVNNLLAWGHARALENLLEQIPDCPRAISDQFGTLETVRRALLAGGRKIKLEQYPRAEADIAVAAASILARHEFVSRLDRLGREAGLTLPKGAGPAVLKAGRDLLAKHGHPGLATFAKLHFKTTDQL